MSFEFHRMGEMVSLDGRNEQCGRCWRPLPPGADSCPTCSPDRGAPGLAGDPDCADLADLFGMARVERRRKAA